MTTILPARKRVIGIDGYCYSSSFNYKLITKLFEIDNIYQKYVTVLRRIYKFMKSNLINQDTSETRNNLFEKFRNKIEKFCIINFQMLDVSIFYDVFNRLMYDIYYRLGIIK